MNKDKISAFFTAISDVYLDREDRALEMFGQYKLSDDVTEDFTEMMLAMFLAYQIITGDKTSDLIDFTHILNKLAIQHVMRKDDENNAHKP